MGISRWEQYKEKNGVTPLDMLNPRTKKVSNEISSNRLSICNGCPEFIKISKQCKKCGCFMEAKAKYEEAKCPLGKW
jgi:hypothetical protein